MFPDEIGLPPGGGLRQQREVYVLYTASLRIPTTLEGRSVCLRYVGRNQTLKDLKDDMPGTREVSSKSDLPTVLPGGLHGQHVLLDSPPRTRWGATGSYGPKSPRYDGGLFGAPHPHVGL
jgi:hypothetical protein